MYTLVGTVPSMRHKFMFAPWGTCSNVRTSTKRCPTCILLHACHLTMPARFHTLIQVVMIIFYILAGADTCACCAVQILYKHIHIDKILGEGEVAVPADISRTGGSI